MFFVDKSGVLKKWSKELHESAYKSKIYMKSTTDSTKAKFNDIYYFSWFMKNKTDLAEDMKKNEVIVEVPRKSEPSDFEKSFFYALYLKFVPYPVDLSPAEFSILFYDFIADSPSYLGCGAIYYPTG